MPIVNRNTRSVKEWMDPRPRCLGLKVANSSPTSLCFCVGRRCFFQKHFGGLQYSKLTSCSKPDQPETSKSAAPRTAPSAPHLRAGTNESRDDANDVSTQYLSSILQSSRVPQFTRFATLAGLLSIYLSRLTGSETHSTMSRAGLWLKVIVG